MILTLHLAAAAGSPDEVRTLDQGTLTIGRGPENGWVVSDPDRTISKQHCRVDRSDDGFLLTDTSTNGVFLNTEVQPLGRGHSHVLAEGDVIVVGPFRITATMVDAPFATPPNAITASLPPLLPESAQPYSGTVHTPGSPIVTPQETPWLESIPGGKFGPGLRPAPQGWEAPPDPNDYAATGLRHAPSPLDEAPLPFIQASEHGDATATLIRLPTAQAVLPTDWNDSDPLEGADLAVLPVDAALSRPTLSSTSAAEPADASLPAHEPRQAWRNGVAPAASSGTADAQSARLIAAFLAGSGLPPESLAGAELETIFHEAGALVRAAVEGVREILATRAMVKSELRADQTVIQAADNNPMKFAPDVQRCLAAMVGQPPVGFMPGAEAMRRSMEDLKRHELALIGALNTVFAEMTTQLDPETIDGHVRNEGGIGGVLPYAREARCWAVYSARYAALQNSGAANTGGSLLAPVAAAYTNTLRRGG